MYKQFNEENHNVYEFTANKNYVKNQSNLTRFNFISASSNTLSASYYHFARINFYLSGSDLSLNEKRFNKIQTPGNLQNNDLTHFNKFYQEGSLVFVPQNEFGDTMKKGTFVLRDNSTSTEIKIIDDLNGNLYAPDATFSQSVSALSSSDNYVGNVFYDIGAFTITETASKTNKPPVIAKTISCLVIIPTVPKDPPKANDPVSPINILAGGALNHKKPKHAPIIDPKKTATSPTPSTYGI